jgi:hypothetical protein
MIRTHPYSSVSENDPRPFFQFKLDYVIDGKFHKLIGWAHPDLLYLLRQEHLRAHVDMTFNIASQGDFAIYGSAQLMVLMVYSPPEEMYVPVFYVLLDSKSETAYYHAFQQLICATDWKFDPISMTCDFEKGLMNMVKLQFPKAQIIGCYFHFKQANRRILKKLQIDDETVSSLINSEGLFNILPLVPVPEITTKGILILHTSIQNFNSITMFFFVIYIFVFSNSIHSPSFPRGFI